MARGRSIAVDAQESEAYCEAIEEFRERCVSNEMSMRRVLRFWIETAELLDDGMLAVLNDRPLTKEELGMAADATTPEVLARPTDGSATKPRKTNWRRVESERAVCSVMGDCAWHTMRKLAGCTGLNVVTVRSVLDVMIGDGRVARRPVPRPGQRGRPLLEYRLVKNPHPSPLPAREREQDRKNGFYEQQD